MTYSINTVQNLALDVNEINPSKPLVFGTNGACIGVCLYTSVEFGPLGDHDDQEGFVIAEGSGQVYLDGEILDVKKDMSLIIAPHVKHSFRRNADSKALKVFWFHAAV